MSTNLSIEVVSHNKCSQQLPRIYLCYVLWCKKNSIICTTFRLLKNQFFSLIFFYMIDFLSICKCQLNGNLPFLTLPQ